MYRVTASRRAGIAIRNARQKHGLTQEQLAKRAGVSTRLVSSLELGDNAGVQLDKLLAVLNSLGLSLFIGTPNDVAGTDSSDDMPSNTPDTHAVGAKRSLDARESNVGQTPRPKTAVGPQGDSDHKRRAENLTHEDCDNHLESEERGKSFGFEASDACFSPEDYRRELDRRYKAAVLNENNEVNYG